MTTMLAIAKKVVALYVDTEREHARAIATRIAADFRAGGFDVVDGSQRGDRRAPHHGRRRRDAAARGAHRRRARRSAARHQHGPLGLS